MGLVLDVEVSTDAPCQEAVRGVWRTVEMSDVPGKSCKQLVLCEYALEAVNTVFMMLCEC